MKSMLRGRAGALALLLGLSSGAAVAADQTQTTTTTAVTATATPRAANQQETVVVTGQREPESTVAVAAAQFGTQVQIISAAQIEASGATNFAEAMQFLVKGVNIGYSPDEGEYTIRLDGGGDRDTLVVLDGVPTYDRGPALEDIWGATTIDPKMIESVEVFRGGNSLFFGSNGGIGVVSIRTKRPDGTVKGDFGVNYGSFNTRELWGNYSFPIDAEGRHSLMVYGSLQATTGPRIFDPNRFTDNVALAGGIQSYPLNRNNIGVKYLWKIDDQTEFRINGQFTEVYFQDAFPNTEVFSPNWVHYPIIDASLERRFSDRLFVEASAYYSNPQLWNTELFPEVCTRVTGCQDPNNATRTIPRGAWTGAVEPFPFKGFGKGNQFTGAFKEYGATARATVVPHTLFEFVAGVQWVRYQDASDAIFVIPDQEQTVTGVFVDLRPKLAFSPDTAISLGIRTDFSDAFDSKTIWKFGFRQPLPFGTYVRANGGTSYSLPRTNELFTNRPPPPGFTGQITSIGNPDLQTEETETYNAAFGIRHSFQGADLFVEIGGYQTDITNRIQTTAGLTPNTWFNNSAVTEIRGWTLEVDLKLGEQWSFNLGYTNQDASDASGSRRGLQINETPAWFIQGAIDWRSKDGRLRFQLLPRIQGSEYTFGGPAIAGTTRPADRVTGRGADTGIPRYRTNFGDYAVVNGTATYFAGEDLQHRFQLRVVNIFDEYYAERWGFGNQFYGSAFNRGEYSNTDDRYFFGYPFEGKPRSFFVSYSTKF
jgi:outer membrane receptor protein involved in Fe transport